MFKAIGPYLLLHFTAAPLIRPIIKHRFEEYEGILNNFVKK
jgi:hypothetical protein